MDGVPYRMWIAYLKLIWSKVGVAPASVLEVCCGTGTLARMLAEDGHKVTGVDVSKPMIREAKKLARDACLSNISFFAQDAATLKLGKRFDAAFAFFDSLNYVTDPARCAAVIGRTATHLNPGAPFVFDLNTAFAFENRMFDQKDMRRKAKVRYDWKGRYDDKTRICVVDMDFYVDGKEFRETHVQRAHSVDEVTGWMADAGFTSLAVYDAYTLDRPKKRSDRINVVGVLA